MVSVYEYFDYQAFLRDYFDDRKHEHSWFSYRYFAAKIKMDHSNLIKVILGKRHISQRNILAIADCLQFSANEREYFTTLVQFNKSADVKKSRQLFEKLIAIKRIELKKIEPHQYDFYREWYHTAVYSLLDYYDFRGNYSALAAELNPPITTREVRESIALLEKLQLIRKDIDGRYIQVEKKITTGQKWHSLAIQRFQEEAIKLAVNSLQNHPRNVRDISTLTVALSQSDMAAIREITEQYRREIVKVIHESGPGDTVYQINIQVFPMTQPKWRLQ
ncbi:MAG: TIGR02147 family protein [Chitinispirillaceae bacterium]|nr:TIGR02147 family protein [Chitinispirillaceae bacterium]